ncbi:MAG: 23S rRNA (pseudouridine(1915)-N(3))-methyltransferase RlmH [Bacteroidales bacterium]
MKIILIFTGKTTEEYLKTGVSVFVERLKHYLPVEITEINPPKYPLSLENSQIRLKESEWVIKNLPKTDYLVLLDETGKMLSSLTLSEFLQSRMNQGIKSLSFLIGGAYGVSDELRRKADFVLSLSSLTFTHQMCRLILSEQLYRAMTILRKEPYHNP